MSSSNLFFDPLLHPSTVSSLQTLSRILETSIGPTGRLKLLENIRALSSSSQRLIYHISIKNIISKVIISTAKNQLKSFNNGGLFCAILTLKLIFAATTDPSQSLPLVGNLYEIFATDFLRLLKENSSLEVDFSNLNHLKSVVLTVLTSKPGCLLSRSDRDHLCSILLKAFLDNIPTDGKSVKIIDSFRFLTVEGLPPIKSKLLKGALLQIPETDKNIFLKGLQPKGPIRIALFTCSLAGDADWPVENIETNSLDLIVESTMRLLDDLVSKLVLDMVDLVFCQKVVHPRMKKRLQKAGILFIDRLGTETAKCIQFISGGNSIASLSCELSYGTVSCINIEQLGRNSFLLLSNDDAPLFTIVLAHYNEETSAELKVVCRQALDSLLRILQSPSVCFGGGCSEIRTGLLLANKIKTNLDTIKNEARCTSGQVLQSLSAFLRGISSTSVAIHHGKLLDFATENIHSHLWKLHDGHFPITGGKCQCGRLDAAAIDPSSWSLLTGISNLYSTLPLISESYKEISAKVSPHIPIMKKDETKIGISVTKSLTTTRGSLEASFIENIKLGVASTNSSTFNLSYSSNSPADRISPLNSMPGKSDLLLSASFSSPSNLNSLNSPADRFSPSNSMPGKSDLLLSASFISPSSLNTNKLVPAHQLSAFDISPILPKTIPDNSEPVTQHFKKVNSPVTVPLFGPVPTTSKSVSQEFQTSSPSPTSKSNDFVLLDELTCKINSLSMAFETASLLLRTTVCINNLPA